MARTAAELQEVGIGGTLFGVICVVISVFAYCRLLYYKGCQLGVKLVVRSLCLLYSAFQLPFMMWFALYPDKERETAYYNSQHFTFRFIALAALLMAFSAFTLLWTDVWFANEPSRKRNSRVAASTLAVSILLLSSGITIAVWATDLKTVTQATGALDYVYQFYLVGYSILLLFLATGFMMYGSQLTRKVMSLPNCSKRAEILGKLQTVLLACFVFMLMRVIMVALLFLDTWTSLEVLPEKLWVWYFLSQWLPETGLVALMIVMTRPSFRKARAFMYEDSMVDQSLLTDDNNQAASDWHTNSTMSHGGTQLSQPVSDPMTVDTQPRSQVQHSSRLSGRGGGGYMSSESEEEEETMYGIAVHAGVDRNIDF